MGSIWKCCSRDTNHGARAKRDGEVSQRITELQDDPLSSWVILHVPHNSTFIPDEARDQFVLDDLQLEHEVDDSSKAAPLAQTLRKPANLA